MANTYFQFKQFRVEQSQCAMKVSTEACILGAWVKPRNNIETILDIGTGTGLLSLMLAQRCDSLIEAIEIDEQAANQAQINFEASPWKKRLSLIQENIFEFTNEIDRKYDMIVCNPPFYSGSLPAQSHQANLARHDGAHFNKRNFAQCLSKLISPDGEAYVLYPELEASIFSDILLEYELYACPDLIIRNQPGGTVFRMILKITTSPCEVIPVELDIRKGSHYTSEFTSLLSDYYLKF